MNIHHHNDFIITNDDDNYNNSPSNYIARNTRLPDSSSSDSKSDASIEQEQEILVEDLEEQYWEDNFAQQITQAQRLIAEIDLENTKKKEKELITSPVATNNLNKGNKNNDNKNTDNLNIESEQRIPINNAMADATAKRLAEIQETTHLMTLMNKLCKSISNYTEKDHVAPQCKLAKPQMSGDKKPTAYEEMKVCFKCRQKGHFASKCTQEFITLKQCTKCNGKNYSEQDCWKNKNQQKCQLCDSTEHIAKNCPTIVSKPENDKICQICDIKGHDARTCYKIGNYVRPQRNYASPTCQLCGIRGHAAKNCGMQRENQQRPQVRFNENNTNVEPT
ncbi:uncharacterized protein LOC122857549 [Aphidius gifuensis]|uniref:uncharacterized protein LOC122857549 n=1 Tax=Aphidius gifuensis TaxID=684658 RepID=UPI001CDBEDAA|nr:uncharacterized protein LOC122857549 [Aphidius gifuensis]